MNSIELLTPLKRELESRVLKRMADAGWSEPTPIQKKSFPVVLRRKHALLVAPTGSGKTEAAAIPIFTLLASEKLSGKKGVKMLYITPLRSLNRDILRRVIGYAEVEGLSAEIRHGDTPVSARKKMVQNPPDVLITTPETLAILLTSRKMSQNLKTLQWVVIDELHELLGSERGAHLTVSLERAQELSDHDIVRLGLSATVGDLNAAAKFLVGTHRKCAVLVDPTERKYDIVCKYVEGSFSEASIKILSYAKEKSGDGSTLIFTNTRDEAEYLGSILKAKSPDIPVEVHHGSLSKETREETEAKLRSGDAGVVVSTSSLELGLDIGVLNLVIQWGSPRQAVKLVQRIGRSRHRVAETALGMIVTNRIDDELEGSALIKRMEKGWFEVSDIHSGSLDVMAHHVVGLTLERSMLRVEQIVSLLGKSHLFRDVDVDNVDLCIQLLERQGIVRYDGEVVRRRGPRTYEYYYENISTIPDIQQFTVIDTTAKKPVGRLDQMFVGEYGEPGKPFILKGSSWKILSIDDEKQVVYVEPLLKTISTVPYWIGELMPVDFHTAVEVGKLRRMIVSGSDVNVSETQVNRLKETQRMLGVLPDDKIIAIEKRRDANTVVTHLCLGTKVNQTLATVLSTLISSKIGYLVEARSDPYRIVLSSQGRVGTGDVVEALKGAMNLEGILQAAIVGTHPLNWKTWHVAKRFGVVMKGAKYDRRASRLIQERYRDTALHKEVMRELFLEKYDLEGTEDVLRSVRSGRIKVVEIEVENHSPLSQPILEYAAGFAALPLTIEKTVLELVKQRLEKARHRLVCLSCGKWERTVKTVEAYNKISCGICKSRIISSTYWSDDELVKLVKKRLRRKEFTAEDKKRMRKAWKVASLIQNFGGTALYVLSGFGVGPEAAGRILRRYVGDDEELLKNIYRAEKTFVTTRGFWD